MTPGELVHSDARPDPGERFGADLAAAFELLDRLPDLVKVLGAAGKPLAGHSA